MVEVSVENGTYKMSTENLTHNAIGNLTDQFDQQNQEMNRVQSLGEKQIVERKGNETDKMIGWESSQGEGEGRNFIKSKFNKLPSI